jgi:hypothetical protein
MKRAFCLLLLLSLPCFAAPRPTATPKAKPTPKPAPATKPDLVDWKFNFPPFTYESRWHFPKTTALPWKPLEKLFVPRGTTNLALNQPVTSSDDAPIIGELKMATDGVKEGTEGHWIELGPNRQWLQIELPTVSRIYALHIWHYFGQRRVYRDVVIQVSNDPEFETGVRTIYNNDDDNSSGLGVGKDREFYENRQGFLLRLPTSGKSVVTGRYVRLYSKGNSADPTNHYIEVEVLGQVAVPGAPRLGLVPWKATIGVEPYYGRPPRNQPPLPKLPVLWVPPKVRNIAKGKYVTASDVAIIGEPRMITDGAVAGSIGHWVEFGPSAHWVQIDLEKPSRIYGLHFWHYYGESRVYRDVIVQVSDDPDFLKGVRTLFNNDGDNSSGKGKGRDKEYAESRFGFLIDTNGPDYNGVVARYVRLYSKGNTSDPLNHYIEVEVIGE